MSKDAVISYTYILLLLVISIAVSCLFSVEFKRNLVLLKKTEHCKESSKYCKWD